MTEKNNREVYADLLEVLKKKSTEEFNVYFQKAWEVLEPKTELLHNWHHDLISEYLMATLSGQIKRLIINVPPRYMKSNLVTVTFPTWCWVHKPELRFIFGSYSQGLSNKHSVDRRTLIESDWYQDAWGSRFKMAHDQNVKTEFQNDKRGVMIATSMLGTVTGKGGDFVIIDDPHSPKMAESDAQRQAAINAFDQTFMTRLDNPNTGRVIVVMQRLNEKDLSGHLIDQGGWEHLKLPGLAEVPEQHYFPVSSRIVTREVGEALHPERESVEGIAAKRKSLGGYGFAGQYQQEPAPLDGGIFKKQWFKRYKELPTKLDETIISGDMAFKGLDQSDYVVFEVWSRRGANKYLRYVLRRRMDFVSTVAALINLSKMFPEAHLKLIEEKANGAAVINALRNKLTGIVAVNPKDSKEARAFAVSPEVEAGNVWLPEDQPWVDDFLTEVCRFPKAKNDDQVDTMTQALIRFQTTKAGNFVDSMTETSESIVDAIVSNSW